MGSWEQTISNALHTLGLDSIKSKILVFALLATLIPSLTMGWLSYVYNKRALTEKIAEELRNVTSQTAHEIDFWLKERLYDARVFASSYEVSENLEKILRAREAPIRGGRALGRLHDYLNSVQANVIHYEELLVIGPKAEVLATSTGQVGRVNLPPDPLKGAKKDKAILGEAYWDEALKKPVITIAVPIKTADGHFLGLLAAKLNFYSIDKILKSVSLGKTGHVYLITEDGALLIDSRLVSSEFMETKLGAKIVRALVEKGSDSLEYTNYQGNEVVGTLKRIPPLDWAAVAEIKSAEAYAQVVRLRNLTLLMVSGLLLGIGLTAYLLGLAIVQPLDRLTNGAAKVAAGDLEVDLPVLSRGEVGSMTEVFNHMVGRLHAATETLSKKNEELAQLSVTDSLTGLYNRKHLLETLSKEVARARRHNHPFSVLMIDIDHFKKYNDRFGHLAGDAVLTKIASIFAESIRTVDYAARYGGEEFLVILPETGLDGALEAAERIRTRVVGARSRDGNKQVGITVSIGVAGFPEHGDTPESVIASADAVLYEAKRRGRNRVVHAGRRAGKQRRGGAIHHLEPKTY